MEPNVVRIDDQPVAATFYEEGHWLTDFITPKQPNILMLWDNITKGIISKVDKAMAAWDWVATQVKYKPFIRASIQVEGITSFQDDFWQTPSMCAQTAVGNCANKAFLLASLLRNEFSENEVYCVLGNLYNGKASGHAWIQVNLDGQEYIMESTRDDVPLLEANKADRYEAVHYLNDKLLLAVPNRTVLVPFMACYSDWLRDYLHWSYIHGGKSHGRRE